MYVRTYELEILGLELRTQGNLGHPGALGDVEDTQVSAFLKDSVKPAK